MSRPIIAAAVVAAAIVLIAVLYFAFAPSPDAPTPVPSMDRGDTARETIAELRDDSVAGETNYDEAYSQAEAHRQDGRLADAQLLYFFAARNGHGPSAFRLAEMNDPLYHDPATSLLPRPDAFQAYRWYSQALEGGVDEAAGRLDALRQWAENEAQAGNAEADRLLLQWD